MQDVLSIAGTRSSHRWQELPGSFDTVNARAIYPSSNEYGIPDLPCANAMPARLLAYSDRTACRNPRDGDAAHFFLDDYRFETLWTKPERPLTRLQRVGLALTPDFSLWTGMPPVMQTWQTYRSRWCGMWMLAHGIRIIPTVSWSTPASYRYCFAGIAPGSVVALTATGVLRDRDALGLFGDGYTAMAELVQPSAVLCYGRWPAILDQLSVPVHEYPARWEERGGRQGK